MTTLAVGTRIGPYEITAKIASGGMGEVYHARHRAMQRDAALKVLLPSLAEDAEFIQRLHREAKAVAALRHPHIVEIYDANVETEPYYLAMEYLPGGSLQGQLTQLRQKGQRMSIPDALSITRQMASALDYAHNKGFIHRDIKPSNVLIAEDGRYVLTDFGIAASQQGTKLTKTSVSMGTPEYMSPEQAQGLALDRRSDLYSLGVMLYEMLSGTVPFTADTPLGVAFKHVRETPQSVAKLRADLTAGVKSIVERAMAKKQADRFQSAAELIAEIDRATVAFPKKRSITPVLFVGLGVVGLIAAGVIGVTLLAGGQTAAPSATANSIAAQAPAAATEAPTTAPLVIASTPTLAPAPTAAPPPTASPVPAEAAVVAAVAAPTDTVEPTSTPTPEITEAPAKAPTVAPTPKPSATRVTATPTAEGDTTTTTNPATGAPKSGQLFAFEKLPSCRRGDEPYGKLSISNDQETVHDGRGSLRLDYDFPAIDKNYVVFSCAAAWPGQPTGMSAWVYGDGSNHFLNVWIKDAAGERRQFSFGRIAHNGWRQMFAVFDTRRAWPNTHIDGTDNGQLDYPIKFDSFVLDGVPDGSASSGTIYLDEVYASQQALPTRVDPTNTPGTEASAVDAAAATEAPAIARGDRLLVQVKESRGSYRQWGKQVSAQSCSTDDALGATLKFDIVLVLTNSGDRDLNDLHARFLTGDGSPLVACGVLPNVQIGSTATVPLNTFAEVAVQQVVISNAAGVALGRACFARPSPGSSDVISLPCN